jgi:signal recognition particle GTPase
MKLAKTLLATTLVLTAASTFAASKHDQVHAPAEEKVVVSTQEQANTANAASDAVGSASEAAPATR